MIWVFLVWVVIALFFTLGALKETRRLLRVARSRTAPLTWPRLQILRPCAGLEPELAENLLSTMTVRYDGPRELFLLVASKSDPAYAVALDVQARSTDVKIVVTDIETQHNRKVAQLARAEGLSDAEVVVVIDSDIVLDDRTLPALVSALLADEKAGAASCPPVDIRATTFGDRVSSALLSSTPHAFYCLAALAERSGGAHVLCGAFIAIHRRVLDQLGGFAALERYLGEDFELARRLHTLGYTIPTAAVAGLVTDHGRSLGAVHARFRRWATVTRQQRPHLMFSYPLLLACTPLILVTALSFAIGAWLVAIVVGVFLVVRITLASTLRAAYGLPADPLRSFVALIFGELLMLVSALGALGPPVVSWRGVRYRVERNGFMERIG